ncbi:MAG: hypothetical protein ACW7DP_17585 [Paraglaciecola chathamensis]
MEIAAVHWINISNGVLNSDRPESAKKRSDGLLELLDNPPLEHTFTKKVRNSWEHHDERLDKILNADSECKRLSGIHVAVNPPKEATLTLKRFDPTNMTIHFLNDVIELTPYLHEMLRHITADCDARRMAITAAWYHRREAKLGKSISS